MSTLLRAYLHTTNFFRASQAASKYAMIQRFGVIELAAKKAAIEIMLMATERPAGVPFDVNAVMDGISRTIDRSGYSQLLRDDLEQELRRQLDILKHGRELTKDEHHQAGRRTGVEVADSSLLFGDINIHDIYVNRMERNGQLRDDHQAVFRVHVETHQPPRQ